MILLLNQYFSDGTPPSMPINLLSLATYMNENNMETKIYEADNDKNIERIIFRENPKIIGIGCQFTPHYQDVIRIAQLIKRINPKIKTVIGGNHASSLDHLDKDIDYIIKGEGEVAFFDLCFKLSVGIWSEPIISHYPHIKLDKLPIINYSLIDLKRYENNSPFFMRKPVMGIITSRGCPNDCIYCTVKGVWGRTWRGKTPERVFEEIKRLNNMGFKEFAILDDNASVNHYRWEEICDKLKKLKIKWFLPNGIAHWTLSKPLLKKMKEAGCYRITFGIESGNKRVRKFIGKPFPLPYDLIKYANRLGMWTVSTNILGFPNETKEEMYDTLNFSKLVDFTTFFVLDSYPTADISKYKLDLTLARKLQFVFYKKFIINRILRFYTVLGKIRSFEDLQYTLRVVWAGIKIFIKSFYKTSTKSLLYD